MEMKGVGNWASVPPMELRAGLEVQKRSGRLGLFQRIATGSEDPTGGGISGRLRARAHSFARSRDNAAAGMDMARTAGGALGGIGEDLTRMRELAMQAANGTASAEDRASLDAEFQALKAGIGDQLETKFGDLELFSGETVSVVVDPDAAAPIDVQLPDGAALAASLADLDVSSQAAAQSALGEADAALEAVTAAKSDLGASEAALGSGLRAVAGAEVQLARAESRASAARDSAVLTPAALMEHAMAAMSLHQGLDSERVADLLSPPF